MRRYLVLLSVFIGIFAALPGTAGAQNNVCYQPTRLIVGLPGRVTVNPPLPNTLRAEPALNALAVGSIPAGAVFDVIGGPRCSSGITWWQVRYNGVIGWTGEGDGLQQYWLEPYVVTLPPACPLPTRLTVGSYGRVTLGLPNNIRSEPTAASLRVAIIPAGSTFYVSGGPSCGADGRWWWQVNYNGITGWTAEGSANRYWVEPLGGSQPTPPPPPPCSLTPRLQVMGQGRVTPGAPNVVRTAPGTTASGADSQVIGSIPGSGVFSVSGGPVCGPDGRWWWYVDYNGLIGWTAEGEGLSNYWVEPWYTGAIQCPNFLVSRLMIGGRGRVNQVPYYDQYLYAGGSTLNAIVGVVPKGGVFTVISGPACDGFTAWWEVDYGGVRGWLAEGNGSSYYLEPF